jgi:hypothetical protein
MNRAVTGVKTGAAVKSVIVVISVCADDDDGMRQSMHV